MGKLVPMAAADQGVWLAEDKAVCLTGYRQEHTLPLHFAAHYLKTAV